MSILSAREILSNRNSNAKIAFATKKALYVVNTKGDNFSGFPKHFKDGITQPISVFNYDNDPEFILYVTFPKKNKHILSGISNILFVLSVSCRLVGCTQFTLGASCILKLLVVVLA